MKPGVTPRLLILLLVLLALLETASVHAVTTFVDQQCSAGGGDSLAGIGNYKPVGQTFTPTETDIVVFSVNIYSTIGDNSTMTATILSGGIGGNVLASKSFLVPPYFGLSKKGDWFNVTFDTGVSVTPGKTYAFDLADNSASSGINWNNCSNSYVAGYGYFVGVPFLNNADFEFMEFSGTFAIEVTPGTLFLRQGFSGSTVVKVTSFGGFVAPVNLTVGNVPSGVTVRLDSNLVTPPAAGSTTTSLSILVTVNATAGRYSITITGISGSQHPSSTLTLDVTVPGDFTISAYPGIIVVPQGASSACTISVGSINGFNSTVAFTGSWLTPSPVGLSFIPPHPVTPSPGTNTTSQLVVVGSVDASTGSFRLSIIGTSGSLNHMINVTVQVQVQAATVSSTTLSITTSSNPTVTSDFSITLPSTMSVGQGSSAATSVSVTSIAGFESAVSLSYSWMTIAPLGVSIDLPGPITPSPGGAATSTLTVSASSTSSMGVFTLIVTGTSGFLSHAANVNIVVNPSPPGAPQCLIATATYGSELSPEVQILRGFRDNYIQRTKAGSSFMIIFNVWYYSFSPYVATYLTNHPLSRMLMKGVLYPIVGVLFLTSSLLRISPTSPEVGVLLAGLFSSGLIGALYVGLPLSLAQAKLRPRRKIGVTRFLFATLLIAIVGVFVGEVLSPIMLLISTPLIVISTILLTGMIVSSLICSSLSS